jgi:hypothetical protein
MTVSCCKNGDLQLRRAIVKLAAAGDARSIGDASALSTNCNAAEVDFKLRRLQYVGAAEILRACLVVALIINNGRSS